MESTWEEVHKLHKQYPELVKEIVTLFWGEQGYALFNVASNTRQFALSMGKAVSYTSNRISRIPNDLHDMLDAQKISPNLSLFTYRKLYKGKVSTEEDIFVRLTKYDNRLMLGPEHWDEIVDTIRSKELFNKYQERILANHHLPAGLRRDLSNKFSTYKLPDTTDSNLRNILPIWGRTDLNPVDKAIAVLEKDSTCIIAKLACAVELLKFHQSTWIPDAYVELMREIANGNITTQAGVGIRMGVTRQRGHGISNTAYVQILNNLRSESCVGLSPQAYELVKEKRPRTVSAWHSLLTGAAVPPEIRKELLNNILRRTLPDW